MANIELKHSFDEFKLYYESTEKVTDRRLDTNRWNYSICTAILVAIGVLVKWSFSSTGLYWVGFVGVAVLCLMAMLFCALWIGQIRDFKKLNNAKFSVLSEMAPLLDFNTDRPGSVVSYCPFEKEWTKLSALNALDEVGKANIVALKSSNVEYFIPKAFGCLFGAILLAVTVTIAFHWSAANLTRASSSVSPSQTTGSRP